MSELAKLGFDTSKPIKWTNALATSAIAELNGYPYNIDQTATPEQWAALQQDLTAELITVAQYVAPTISIESVRAIALAKIRAVRTEAFRTLDYMQLDALAASNTANTTAIQTARVALRDITKIDVSSLTTETQINAVYKAAYLQIVAAMPNALKAVYAEVQNV